MGVERNGWWCTKYKDFLLNWTTDYTLEDRWVDKLKNNYNIQDSINRCKKYRLRILEFQQVTALHIAPAFSSIEILDVIYNGLMDKEQLINGKEYFIMSKGHGCIGQYVIFRGLKNNF